MSTLLDASSLTFSYGRQSVLREVSLRLDAGEVVALLGPNGSGKSTLIKVLLGHLHGSGHVAWDGRPLAKWTQRALARRVAYLPQSPAYDPEQAVADVLRLGRAPYWGAFGLESTRDIGVVARVSHMLSLDDLLQRRMDELSGGQRQRVLVGRCLAQEPAALLLDEPNTFMDLHHQVELCRLVQRLARENHIGVLMASHDLNLAGTFADRLILLHDGAVACEGSAQHVLDPALLERVYQLKMQRLDREGKSPVIVPDV